MLHRSEFRFAATEVEADGTFSGYGSVFGVVDTYGDIVVPGAYRQTLADHAAAGTRPKGLWQHDTTKPILTWTDLREDAKGLWCKGRLILEVALAREAHALLKAGEVDGLSIGFEVGDNETVDASEVESRYQMSPVWGPAGASGRIRMVKSLALWEISLVTFPSNPSARIGQVKARRQPDLTPVAAALARRQLAIGRVLAA